MSSQNSERKYKGGFPLSITERSHHKGVKLEALTKDSNSKENMKDDDVMHSVFFLFSH